MIENGSIIAARPYPSPSNVVKLTEITYQSGEYRVKGLLAQPTKEGDYDGLIYLRGGLQHVGMVRAARIAQFAQQGFIVFAPYYRGNRGGQGRDEFAGDDRYDALYAVDVLKQYYKGDRIHVYGFSRGGMMAQWLGIMRQDVTSVVTWAGVSDVMYMYYERLDMRRTLKRIIGGTPEKYTERYYARTPLMQLHRLQAPLLIIHGEQDAHVDVEHAYFLQSCAQTLGKDVTLWLFEYEMHHFKPIVNIDTVRALCTWMKAQ
ncbi:alpha/beta hydrolase family protein [Caryophanon latum]|uniref:Peptidase n=1 Tax=Caryophanon latum TaxID=33977 RepID=A0A1C0Z0L9_9BACL|nr:prolyl oligopeptidase family serine peptidase [Caryophanon latum]OCS92910.1 peptidase [Caryophanon latum]